MMGVLVVVVLAIIGAVVATYSTFETKADHNEDYIRLEKKVEEIRQDVKKLLSKED
jgi:hypothetical protein